MAFRSIPHLFATEPFVFGAAWFYRYMISNRYKRKKFAIANFVSLLLLKATVYKPNIKPL